MTKAFSIVGMVHLAGLSPQLTAQELSAVEKVAVDDALALQAAGFNAIMIENFGDTPFFPDRVPAHTVASMTRIAHSISLALEQESGTSKIGINVLRNDALSALSIAKAVDATFIRVNILMGAMVTDQGIIEGKAHEVIRTRNQLNPGCEVWADLRVKHAASLAPRELSDEAKDLWKRSGADAIIVSGARTGAPLDLTELRTIKQAIPESRVIAGSGVTPEQLEELVPLLDGIIVGSWIKKEGLANNPVDLNRAKSFIKAVQDELAK